ncbi:hypothetical protein Ancab_035502 [Ancistrocladus abbreviatus]
MLKLLQSIFKCVSATFGLGENYVEDINYTQIVNTDVPSMVEYVKGLEAELGNGAGLRLLAIVKDLEQELAMGKLELENAKERITTTEDEKEKALCKLRDTEDRLLQLKESLMFLLEGKKGSMKDAI